VCDGGDWNEMDKDSVAGWDFVSTVMKFRVSWKQEISWTGREPLIFQ